MSPLACAFQPFKRYADFRGRSRRCELWWFTLLLTVLIFVANFSLGFAMGVAGFGPRAISDVAVLFEIVMVLATLLPSLAVAARRLHDIGLSGWWLLLSLVPFIGGIVLLVFYCLDSRPGANKWGPNPKSIGVVPLPTSVLAQSQ